jgi:carboxyl-terminal processing protease
VAIAFAISLAGWASATLAAPSQASPRASARSLAPPPNGVPACEYVPGSPVAEMPEEVLNPVAPTPTPRPTPPVHNDVDPALTRRQLGLLQEIWSAVKADYVFADFNGVDWEAVGARYRQLVSGGFTDADFYIAMDQLITELGDQHSYYLDPEEARKAEQVQSGSEHIVGIGINAATAPDGIAVVLTYPGGAAQAAGIRAHDVIVAVDSEPILDASGTPAFNRLRGDPGTTVVVTVRHPDGAIEDLALVRSEFSSATPVPFCLVPGTRIGYVLLATLYDETLVATLRDELERLASDGPLDGLIIDNRMNGGGLGSVLVPVLSFFMDGRLGYFAGRKLLYPVWSQPEDVGGSQSVPLAVLIGPDTNSFGEVMSGVLQQADGAVTVGRTTRGNVEVLGRHAFSDGSQAWVAQELFVPVRTRYGPWDKTGIHADVSAPTRWDLYDEQNDPGLAAAVSALQRLP